MSTTSSSVVVSSAWAKAFSCTPATSAGSTSPDTQSLTTSAGDSTETLANKKNYSTSCVVIAEYIWLDAFGQTRSKTRTLASKPAKPGDVPKWNFDGSSTGQAPGENSEIFLIPCALFKDPFRSGRAHNQAAVEMSTIMVLCECVDPENEEQPAIGNDRKECKEIMERYKDLKPWFGMEQEYTLMRVPAEQYNGAPSTIPLGFNLDGSEPAPQGPYYCGQGAGIAIGRHIAEVHFAYCLAAGVKVAGLNAEVMPGQWEFQVGVCEGIEMADHLVVARYILNRVAEEFNVQVSYSPKPVESGDWNGAGCHTNFSIEEMRTAGGYDVIVEVCEAFGKTEEKIKEHISDYGDVDENKKRLTGAHETCSITEFKYGVADRGASIRIPREAALEGKGYLEDRRPSANCDPYRVTKRMMKTTGECVMARRRVKSKSALGRCEKIHSVAPREDDDEASTSTTGSSGCGGEHPAADSTSIEA
ncbi:unnamed protein product [Amoebophrya sp. A120]|nr:unnamed protein product [Amoebophrya sp. A120]|eukprot:GSA120T00021836001.1